MTVSLRGSWQGFIRRGLFATLVFANVAIAAPPRLVCAGRDAAHTAQNRGNNNTQNQLSETLQIDNARVLRFKLTTPNQYQARGFVQGRIVKNYGDQGDHAHFAIQIGRQPSEILEVVYNKHFGQLPPLRIGSVVTACGDYITATARSPQGHPASPAGAIIHWVHMSDNGNHPDGYVMIDNVMYGNRPGR